MTKREKTVRFEVRCTPPELHRWRKLAASVHETLSALVRRAVREVEAKRELDER